MCDNSSLPKTSQNAVGIMDAPTWKIIGTQENDVSWRSVGHGYRWEQREPYGSGLWMQRKNFITSDHDVHRKRLRPWTVYELATTCSGRFLNTGDILPKKSRVHTHEGLRVHACVDGSMTKKYNIHMLKYIMHVCTPRSDG